MDINLVKIDKILGINKIEPVSFEQFSAGIIPGIVSAAGFDLSIPTEKFSIIDWYMILKLVNASKENIIIENIQANWVGKNNYRAKSNDFLTQIYTASGDNEEDIINKLLDMTNDKKTPSKQILFLPFLLECEREKIIRVNFVLETYKRIFLNYWKPIFFKKEEIKAPETYIELLQKAFIKIKINKKKQPLLLKI